MQFSQFDVGAEYQRQRIKSVSGSDAVAGADIPRELLLESLALLSEQIPSRFHHTFHRLLDFPSERGCYIPQIKKFNHYLVFSKSFPSSIHLKIKIHGELSPHGLLMDSFEYPSHKALGKSQTRGLGHTVLH